MFIILVQVIKTMLDPCPLRHSQVSLTLSLSFFSSCLNFCNVPISIPNILLFLKADKMLISFDIQSKYLCMAIFGETMHRVLSSFQNFLEDKNNSISDHVFTVHHKADQYPFTLVGSAQNRPHGYIYFEHEQYFMNLSGKC